MARAWPSSRGASPRSGRIPGSGSCGGRRTRGAIAGAALLEQALGRSGARARAGLVTLGTLLATAGAAGVAQASAASGWTPLGLSEVPLERLPRALLEGLFAGWPLAVASAVRVTPPAARRRVLFGGALLGACTVCCLNAAWQAARLSGEGRSLGLEALGPVLLGTLSGGCGLALLAAVCGLFLQAVDETEGWLFPARAGDPPAQE